MKNERDLIAEIGELVQRCGVCNTELIEEGPSDLYCDDVCQDRFMVAQGQPLVGYHEPTDLPEHVNNETSPAPWGSADSSPATEVRSVQAEYSLSHPATLEGGSEIYWGGLSDEQAEQVEWIRPGPCRCDSCQSGTSAATGSRGGHGHRDICDCPACRPLPVFPLVSELSPSDFGLRSVAMPEQAEQVAGTPNACQCLLCRPLMELRLGRRTGDTTNLWGAVNPS